MDFSLMLSICKLLQYIVAIAYYVVSLILTLCDRKRKSEPSVRDTEAHFSDDQRH